MNTYIIKDIFTLYRKKEIILYAQGHCGMLHFDLNRKTFFNSVTKVTLTIAKTRKKVY